MKIQIAPSFWTSGIFKKDPLKWFHNIEVWVETHFTKLSFKLLWQWFKGYPWDSSYLLDLEQAKLREMIAYQEKVQRFVGWEYVVRDMKICVSLIDIINEHKQLYTYTGDYELSEPDENGVVEWLPGTLEHHCLVYVNMKNMSRFLTPQQMKSNIWTKFPEELYREKAKALYYKIRSEHTDEWCD